MESEWRLKCPYCGGDVVINCKIEGSGGGLQTEQIFSAADDMFTDMKKHFTKIFHPSLWK